eukprot:364267-Chlamydomonas_euryale.AAC.5
MRHQSAGIPNLRLPHGSPGALQAGCPFHACVVTRQASPPPASPAWSPARTSPCRHAVCTPQGCPGAPPDLSQCDREGQSAAASTRAVRQGQRPHRATPAPRPLPVTPRPRRQACPVAPACRNGCRHGPWPPPSP